MRRSRDDIGFSRNGCFEACTRSAAIRAVIRNSPTGKLEFDEVLMRVAADAQFVLSEQLRHSILQVTHT